MMIVEVADKIPHPSVLEFWLASAFVYLVAYGSSRVARRMWPGLALAILWLAGTVFWASSFFFESEDLPGSHFPDEVGTGYFVHLLTAASIPVLLIATLAKSKAKPGGD